MFWRTFHLNRVRISCPNLHDCRTHVRSDITPPQSCGGSTLVFLHFLYFGGRRQEALVLDSTSECELKHPGRIIIIMIIIMIIIRILERGNGKLYALERGTGRNAAPYGYLKIFAKISGACPPKRPLRDDLLLFPKRNI